MSVWFGCDISELGLGVVGNRVVDGLRMLLTW